jgi:hypothetical protein
MAVRDTLSASVAGTSGRIRNLIVGETSTFKATENVQRAEHETIWGGTLPQANFEAAYRKDVQEKNQSALCLSGRRHSQCRVLKRGLGSNACEGRCMQGEFFAGRKE